jgi:hypothetical protein
MILLYTSAEIRNETQTSSDLPGQSGNQSFVGIVKAGYVSEIRTHSMGTSHDEISL